MNQRVLVGILAGLILLMLLVLWSAVSRDRDLTRGEELFAQGRYMDALGYLLAAERQAGPFRRAEVLHRIATCYLRLDQCDRANDFFFMILQENAGGEWADKAKQGIDFCFNRPTVTGPGGGPGVTALVAAQRELRRHYTQLLVKLADPPRADVDQERMRRAQVQEAYEAYKLVYKAYTDQITQALKDLDRGGG